MIPLLMGTMAEALLQQPLLVAKKDGQGDAAITDEATRTDVPTSTNPKTDTGMGQAALRSVNQKGEQQMLQPPLPNEDIEVNSPPRLPDEQIGKESGEDWSESAENEARAEIGHCFESPSEDWE